MRSLSDTLFFTKVFYHLCVAIEIINKLQRSFIGYKGSIITVWCVVLVIRLTISTSVRSLSLTQSGPMRLYLRHNFSGTILLLECRLCIQSRS